MTNEYSSKAEEILNWLSPGSAPHRKGEALKQLTDLITQAQIDQIDAIIDLQSKQFNRWTQKDIANFFDGVGKQYRALQSTLKKEQ